MTVIWAVSPSWSPPSSVDSKVVVSPALSDVERLVDALDQLAGADLVGDAAGGVDLGAVDLGDEVELGEVALLGGAVDRDERAEAAAQVVELVLDVVRRHLDGVDGELEAVVLGQVELGAHVDLDGELRGRREKSLSLGPLDDVGLGTTERAELLLGDRLAVELVEAVADGVVEHLVAADALVDDAAAAPCPCGSRGC